MTMWGKEDKVIAEGRQAQLEQTFWASMIKLHAQVARFGDTHADGWSIIDKLKFRTPRPLKLQKEMVDEGKELADTAAGAEVEKQMKKLIAEHEAKTKELMEKAEEARIVAESVTKAALEKAGRAEAAVKHAEEAVKTAQTEAAKADALAKLELASERAQIAEEHFKEKQAAMDEECKMWLEEQSKSKEKLQALDRGIKDLHKPAPVPRGIFNRLAITRDEGKRQAGFLGELFGMGAALVGKGLKEAGAVFALVLGKGDEFRKAYDEDMFEYGLKEAQKGGQLGAIGGAAGMVKGMVRNVAKGVGILVTAPVTPRSEA
ncbi:hypothetical protein OG21DRAFT_1548571 [Imleria badia]|nr:hypothetical protein OG21DRAFT_1548571 [Imleria badia]